MCLPERLTQPICNVRRRCSLRMPSDSRLSLFHQQSTQHRRWRTQHCTASFVQWKQPIPVDMLWLETRTSGRRCLAQRRTTGSSSTPVRSGYQSRCDPRHLLQVGDMLQEGQSCMRVSTTGIGTASSWLCKGRWEQMFSIAKIDNHWATSRYVKLPRSILRQVPTLYIMKVTP